MPKSKAWPGLAQHVYITFRMAEASEDLPEDVRQIGSTASQLHCCGVKALHFTVEKSKQGTRRLPSSVSSQTSGSSVPVFASG
mmetsp:Transcript_31015/g.63892  ORF Transcript_31015/g.63892 Transcript_31015/m.63892 type:complete len:83 (+) Transcript_31015:480-728(+)